MNPDSILNYAPLGLICITLLVGLILALVRWQQHPGVSLLTLLGCGILLFSLVGGTLLDRWIWMEMGHEGAFAFRWVRVLVSSAGYAMLFWAIFGWRQRRWEARPYDDRRYDDRRYDPRYDEDPRPERRFGPSGEGGRGGPEDVRRPDY